MTVHPPFRRFVSLRRLAPLVIAALFFKVLLAILAEYRWYFPADFEHSAFLSGKTDSFAGLYATAFYGHILAGPPAIVLALFLIFSGDVPRLRRWHRIAGRSLAIVVLAFLVPSGLVMARQSYAGPFAAAGFAALALATGICTAAAAWFAFARNVRSHRQMAFRCFLLLASPLLLRLASGVAMVMDWESDRFYQFNAWLSWLVPLFLYECWSRSSAIATRSWRPRAEQPDTAQVQRPVRSAPCRRP